MHDLTDEVLQRSPPASSEHARRVMVGNRSESAAERELRSELHRRGRRFRKQYQALPGVRCRVDIAFPGARIAVFVDGCFWHRCAEHVVMPKANRAWWEAKLSRNVARDRRNDQALEQAGWRVVRVWTHVPVSEMADEAERVLDDAQGATKS
jgi:DNA mismatch endonuclease (patch repair protein)